MRTSIDSAWEAEQARQAEADRTRAARAAERSKASMAAAAALGSSASGRGGLSNMQPAFKSPPSEVPRSKPPPPDLPKAGPPVTACPASKPAAPSPSTLGSSASGAQGAAGQLSLRTLGSSASGAQGAYVWPGPPVSRGPELGGAYTAASVAGSAFTSFHPPVGILGKSIQMRKASDRDRFLQSFPKDAFQFVPSEDPPILGVLAGPDGPG